MENKKSPQKQENNSERRDKEQQASKPYPKPKVVQILMVDEDTVNIKKSK